MRRHLLITFTLAVGTATAAVAQSWDSPSFFSPRPGEDIGAYIIMPDIDGADLGFAGIWRQSGNINLGVRAGIAGGDHFSVGAELYGPLNLLGPQSPLLLSWVGGLGADFNEVTALKVPLGVSAGINLGTGGIAITPYVHPRVAFTLAAYDNAAGEEQTDTDFDVDLDIGADAALGSSFVLRVGVTLGRTNVFGAGIAYRMSRRIEVR